MKKFLSILSLITIFSLAGCSFSEEENDLLSAPAVDVSSYATISHARHNSSNTEVFIYRMQTYPDSKKSVHIATLYPKNIAGNNDLVFTDKMVYENYKYKYQFVFIDSETEKYYTEWSEEIKVAEGQSSATTPNLSYKISSGSYIAYDQDNNTLQIGGDTIESLGTGNTNPYPFLTKFSPCLVLNNQSRSAAFDLSAEQLSGTSTIPTTIVPKDFYDTKITCDGIVGKYILKNSDEKPICIYWTEPSTIKMVYSEDKTTECPYFTVSIAVSTGISY